MARSQNSYWGQHELDRVCFGLSGDMEHDRTEPRQRRHQRPAKESNPIISLPKSPFYSDTYCLMSNDGDQVVPSSQRRRVIGGGATEPKPLPPPPDPEELMTDEAADQEVEFFTSDRRRLLPKSCPKATVSSGKGDRGQVNAAYRERLPAASPALAFSWPGGEDRPTAFGAISWTQACHAEDRRSAASPVRETPCGQAAEPSGLRFSYPASSPPHTGTVGGGAACRGEKPQIPPRIPIPRRAAAPPKAGCDEDRPPKVPPRVPLVPPCPPRTPSPKSLPIYINGVMPATQSFAANPKYVSRVAAQRPHSERAPPAGHFSPCIVPILKDGRQASATHYILLPPGRPARERLVSDPVRTGSGGVWQNR